MGTPKSLDQAIALAMCMTKHEGITFPAHCRKHVKDFLAQKFQTALIKAGENKETEEALLDLWFKITGERIGQ